MERKGIRRTKTPISSLTIQCEPAINEASVLWCVFHREALEAGLYFLSSNSSQYDWGWDSCCSSCCLGSFDSIIELILEDTGLQKNKMSDYSLFR